MNWFEFHLGDYAEATAHLSMLEDAVYMRLLRRCYSTERALPADVPEVCRLVRARSRLERAAVAAVLGEFFVLEGDGWHNLRADTEIAAYHAAQPAREQKARNEDERQRRHREERAALFDQLRAAGIHAAWNESMARLRELVSRHVRPGGSASAAVAGDDARTEPATEPATAPATAPATPATATHPPLPTSQEIQELCVTHHGGASPARVCVRDGLGEHGPETAPATRPATAVEGSGAVPSRAGLLCARLKAAGLPRVSPSHPTLLVLMGLGATDAEFLDALPQALGKSDGFAYLLAVVKARREQAAQLEASGVRGAVAPVRSVAQDRLVAAAILTGSAARSSGGARRLDSGGAIDVDARVMAG